MPAQGARYREIRRRNATALRDVITLQREMIEKSETGKITSTWIDIVTDFADVESMKVRRALKSGQVVEETTHRIKMRYRDDLIAKGAGLSEPSHRHRIMFQGIPMTVHSAEPDSLKRFIELTATRESNH